MKRSATVSGPAKNSSSLTKKPRSSNKPQRSLASKNFNNVRTGLGFPKQMTMTHRYCARGQLQTGASGVLASVSYRCNGMYDPDYSGTGHQPYYFDQISAVYNHWTVIGSKITIRVAKSDANVNSPIIIGCMINDDGTVTPNIDGLCEHPSSTHRVLGYGNPATTFIKKWSAKKTFGGSVLSNPNLQGSASADPTEQSMFTIFINSEPSVVATSVTIDVTIDYIAVWSELKDIATS